MGLTQSQEEEEISLSASSNEIRSSLKQVVHAFRRDIPFLIRHHQATSNRDLGNLEEKEGKEHPSHGRKSAHHRSRSYDKDHANAHKPFPKRSSSIKERWQCQSCQRLNASDCQLCSHCGSSQINVYIPIFNPNVKKTNQKEDPSAINNEEIQFDDQNRSKRMNNENDLDEKNIYRRSVLITHKRKADENLVLTHVAKLLSTLSLSHTRFEDETFSASLQSLYINGHSLSKTTLDLLPNQQTNLTSDHFIQWLRPDQINPPHWTENQFNQWAVYRNPKPNDVLQGALGDCWFITALSVLAEEAEYLMKVLTTKEYNYEGVYYVRLCKDGQWTQVVVDDRFPCTSKNRLAYSQAHRKQLWVPLIEKALAKLNGSYESIIAGRCCEGLATVTGSPCETLILGKVNNPDDKNIDQEKLWKKLLHAREQRFLMCAMCSNNTITQQEFQRCGLLNIHAYSLQDVQQSNDGKFRLIKLRNPWGGTFRWNGDWSDQSHLWNEYPHLRRELLFEKRNRKDGVFWMPFTSFLKYFECVDICKIRPHWYELRDSANFYPQIGMMQAYYLNIQTPTELDITLHRKICENLRIQRSEVSLCVAIVSLEEQSPQNYRIYSMPILSQRGQHKFISTDGHLQPGNYVILPFLFNPANKQMNNTEFNLAVHSSRAIDLERFQISLRIEREFLIKLCLFHGEQVQTRTTNEKQIDDGIQIYELKKYWDGLILLVENRNKNKNLHFHFRCTLSQNAFISRKDSHHQLFDVIPSMHRQIIVTIARKNASHSFTIGHDFQYTLSSQHFIKNLHLNKQKHWPQINESTFSEDIHLPQPISNTK